MTGTLHIVATPIGNLGDLTIRAAEVLGRVGLLACEDTRRTSKLFVHLGLERPPMVVVNEHSEASAVRRVLEALADGIDVALVSDAGTPLVSDPGHVLVGAAVAAGVRIEPVPGASAVLAALAVSGLPTDRFCFDGFLPRKAGARGERIDELARERRTVVLYESPRRVAATIGELCQRLGGDRRIAIARELTKLHEEVWRGDLDAAVEWIAGREPRGEYVLVIGGARDGDEADDDEVRRRVAAAMAGGATRRDATTQVATELGLARNRVYELALTVTTP